MRYDPIKKNLGEFFNRSPWLRKLFYHLLDLLLLRSWYVQYELRKWAKKAGNKVHVLDAGSGFGQYTYFLSRMRPEWNILAVDVKEEQVCDCNGFFRRLGREQVLFKTADLLKMRHDNAFDLILSIDVMECIADDMEVFRNFQHSLKEGGMLLVSTPSDINGSDEGRNEGSWFIEEQVREGYNIDEIQEKLRAAGFSRVRARYSYGTMGRLSWKLSVKLPMLLLGYSKLFFVILPVYYLFVYPVSFVLNMLDMGVVHRSGSGLIVKAYK
ncbi:MAG: methyltransferase domain-containing protein [Flavobacteriales bacterium]|nr:methyltransferase domain-containing protein [Flavobacteriales bacterium]